MALVPNGRMRAQVGQSLLRNGLFSFAQAQPKPQPQQQEAKPQPKTDPRLQIEQQNVPAGGQPSQAPSAAPGGETAGQEQAPGAANMDVMKDRVQQQAETGVANETTPAKGGGGENAQKKGLVKFTKEIAQKIMGIPGRKLEEMGGFVQFKSDAQHNDKVDLKFPNWYWGRTELGEVSKQHKMEIIKAAQQAFNLFYEGSSGDDDTFTMSFSTSDPRQGMETTHDARLKRTYKQLAQPNAGKPGAAKAASTMGELIKGRREELFTTMRKIANGSK